MNCFVHNVESDKGSCIKWNISFHKHSIIYDDIYIYCLTILPVLLVLLFSLSCSLIADTLILIPTGNTLGAGQTKFEGILSNSNKKGNYFQFAGGFDQFEVSVIRAEYNNNPKAEYKYNMQWNFLPETYFTPAIGFGVVDISSQSKEGIGPYAVLTKKIPVTFCTKYVKELSTTMGFGFRGVRGFFFGFECKFPYHMFGEVEFDGDYWNSAIGWEPIEGLRLKTYNINSDQFFGIEFKNGLF